MVHVFYIKLCTVVVKKCSCFVFILQSHYSSIVCILFPFWDCANHIMGTVWKDNCSSIVLTRGLIRGSDNGVQCL